MNRPLDCPGIVSTSGLTCVFALAEDETYSINRLSLCYCYGVGTSFNIFRKADITERPVSACSD